MLYDFTLRGEWRETESKMGGAGVGLGGIGSRSLADAGFQFGMKKGSGGGRR